MPLLKRQPFIRNKPPPDLKPNEELFYCHLTKEIFRNYNDFFERIILCNSLVWTCEITGKPNLTFQEALESERKARKCLGNFSLELRRALLLIASMTHRGKISDLWDDVFHFVKDRYFIGEIVEAYISNSWTDSRILRVIPPTSSQVSEYYVKTDRSLSDKIVPGTFPSFLYRYEVEELSIEEDGGGDDIQTLHIIRGEDVRRPKGIYTREKSRLYLKQSCELEDGIYWKVKDTLQAKYKLKELRLGDIFAGPVPRFPETVNSIKKFPLKPNNYSDGRKQHKSSDTQNDKKELIQQKLEREKQEQERLRKQEEKVKEKEKKKEEKRLMTEWMKVWSRPKEDLECDDLKTIPEPTKVQCRIPNALFGDFLMIIEFLHTFRDILVGGGNQFPQGMTLFDWVERGLAEQELHGPLSDLLQILLRTIFFLQTKEDEEVQLDALQVFNNSFIPDNTGAYEENLSSSQAVNLATIAATWSHFYHKLPIHKLALDHFTLSEVLRMHLLSSGAYVSENSARWRYQQRGGYTSSDDPAIQLRLDHPKLFQQLSMKSIFELEVDAKLKVLSCLSNQILTYAMSRDHIDDSLDKAKQFKSELRSLYQAEQRWEKEERNKDIEEAQNAGKSEFLRLKKEKDEFRHRNEFQRRVRDLQQQISLIQKSYALIPLGRDRFYRRFWCFPSVPGLFVEDDDEYIGNCLPKPTPHNPDSCPLTSQKIVETIQNLVEEHFEKGTSLQLPLSNAEIITPISNGNADDISESCDIISYKYCSANLNNCPVHSNVLPRTKWSFYGNPELLSKLIDSLNPRGLRERELRESLHAEQEAVLNNLQHCQIHKLDQTQSPPNTINEQRKSERQKEKKGVIQLNFAGGNSVIAVLELSLRDFILEMEEKIHFGGLGSLKFVDRQAWRGVLEGNGEIWSTTIKFQDMVSISGALKFSEFHKEYDSYFKESYLDAEEHQIFNSEYWTIKILAYTVLQLAQGVEPKYLGLPLADEDKSKKKKKEDDRIKKEDTEEEKDEKGNLISYNRSTFERWCASLMSSTSFSQIFLHLSTLDGSITWSRSVLKARCRICRRKGEEDKMLLCDGCDKGHHIYCLKPKLKKIPEGDWYCDICKPKEVPSPPRKVRRTFFEEEEEEEGNEDEHEENSEIEEGMEEEEEDDDDDEEMEVETFDEENDCEEENSSEGADNIKYDELSAAVEVCSECNEPGMLLCCDTCPALFHLDCLNPPLKKVPRGAWSCPFCIETNHNSSNSQFHNGTPHSFLKKKNCGVEELGKRRSASEAIERISQVAKKLRNDDLYEGSETESEGYFRSRAKRSLSARRLAEQNELPLHFAALDTLLCDLARHSDSWPFLRAVTRKEAPDYHDIIKRPMDLGTMKGKLNSMQYATDGEFMADALLIFQNCCLYNREETLEYKAGCRLVRYLQQRAVHLGLQVPQYDIESVPSIT